MDYSDIAQLGIGTAQLLHGWTDTEYIANPAAGEGFTYYVPPDSWVRPLSIYFTLATSATAGNRYALYTIKDGDGNIFTRTNAGTGQPASITSDYSLVAGMPVTNAIPNVTANAAIPDLVIPSGWQIELEVIGILAGDQVSTIRMMNQRYPSGIASGDFYHAQHEMWERAWKQIQAGMGKAG